MMKAIVYTRYGPPEVLQLKDVDKPIPKDHQILVKVHAASVNAMDYRRFEKQSALGRFIAEVLTKSINTVPGTDVAGVVEAVGTEVTDFKVGDAVFGVAPATFAEYVANGATKFALKPANISFEQAAAVPVAAFTALQGLRNKGHIQRGQKVLIYGASGGVGIYAVQIAKAFGAEVTAVCSTRNIDMVRSIGADHVIDYKHKDFSQSGQQYDLIYAVNGNRTIQAYRRALKPNGLCVVAGGAFAQVIRVLLFGWLVSKFSGKKIIFQGIASTPKDDLLVIKDMLETGKLMPMLDKCYPLSETASAIRYLLENHAQGKVVITMETK